jgi:copper homeostasis protein
VRGVELEICVEDQAGIAAAIAGGADRIELCSALMVGGLTPSAALADAALELAGAAGVRVHAMIRPRGGNFTYDGDECALAVAEARSLIGAGIDGLVFGAVRDGRLDEQALAHWVETVRAESATVRLTLHRAVDVIDDTVSAVDVAIRLGFDRILTSGGAAGAPDGAAAIAQMVERADGRCRIMGGAGVRPDNAAAVLATGIHDLHGSASRAGAAMSAKLVALGFGPVPRPTDRDTVLALRRIIDHHQQAATE